jgi:hypothetical protein
MLKYLKRNWKQIAALAALAIYVGGLLLWWSYDFPTGYYDQCQHASAHNQNNDCSPYNVYLVALGKVGETIGAGAFINAALTIIAAFITAVATVYIARFTKTLYTVSRDQLTHSHQVERAYVTVGGAPQVNITDLGTQTTPGTMGGGLTKSLGTTRIPTGAFQLTLSNNGKTLGDVWQIGIGFCDANQIPPDPQYAIRHWSQRIGPGVKDEPLVVPYAMPSISPLAVYARVFYSDIFGGNHSSGFVHLVNKQFGTSEPWPAPRAYTEERDEP